MGLYVFTDFQSPFIYKAFSYFSLPNYNGIQQYFTLVKGTYVIVFIASYPSKNIIAQKTSASIAKCYELILLL